MSPRVLVVWIWCVVAVFILATSPDAGALQFASARARSTSAAIPPSPGDAPKPEVLNADTNPTLHYPVAVNEDGSVSSGWLDISRNHVLYSVVVSQKGARSAGSKKFLPGVEYLVAPPAAEAKEEGFEANSNEITGAQFAKGALLFYVPGRKLLVIYLAQNQWYMAQNQRSFFALAEQNLAGTSALLHAIKNFESALLEVKPPEPPEVSLHAEPGSVEKGKQVKLIWTSRHATKLDLEPGIGRVAATGEISLAPQDSANYVLTATGPAGTRSASTSITVTLPIPVPTLVMTEPSVADGQSVEVAGTPLVIRGVVMDASGMPVVTVNGKSVTMRPTSAQAAQFASDPLALQTGENPIEVSAVNSAQGRTKVSFTARLALKPQPVQPIQTVNSKGLDKAEILSLLQGDVPSDRVAQLVKERGIKFTPTPDDLHEIRSAGGSDDLIDALNNSGSAVRNASPR